ncbi:hypothetical protein J3Q64DRAFT_1761388, partial [Phycomyces blakesleeanus]
MQDIVFRSYWFFCDILISVMNYVYGKTYAFQFQIDTLVVFFLYSQRIYIHSFSLLKKKKRQRYSIYTMRICI